MRGLDRLYLSTIEMRMQGLECDSHCKQMVSFVIWTFKPETERS
jgi:hypothetical protein